MGNEVHAIGKTYEWFLLPENTQNMPASSVMASLRSWTTPYSSFFKIYPSNWDVLDAEDSSE